MVWAWSLIRGALSALGTGVLVTGVNVGTEVVKKATIGASVIAVWYVVLLLVPQATVDPNPPWMDALNQYIFPVIVALQKLPIIGTLVDVLYWLVVFEMTYFLFRMIIRIGSWAGFTGQASPYDRT